MDKHDVERSRLVSLLVGVGLLLGCSSSRPSPEPLAQTHQPVFQLEATTTVETGTASPRERTCPGHRLPDQCGGWAGVELVATSGDDDDDRGHGRGHGQEHSCKHRHHHQHHAQQSAPAPDDSTDETCLCQAIEIEIPNELPLTSGNAGHNSAKLSFRTDAGRFVECHYRGNATRGAHGALTGGDKYVFERCSDGSQAGDSARADWFQLELEGGGKHVDAVEVRLRLGAPDVVGGVVQEQIFYSNDARIPGAALHVPRGAAPAFESFSLDVLTDVPIGTSISNAGDGFTSAGYLVDVHAQSSATFTFSDVPGASCPRIELPYDAQTLAALVGAGHEASLSARQLTTLTGIQSGAGVLAPVAPPTVNLARGTISFCVQHLSFYLPGTPTFASNLVSATIAPSATPGSTTNLLATLPTLTPGSTYQLALGFQNMGSTTWDSVASNVRLIAVKPPVGTFPDPVTLTPVDLPPPWGVSIVSAFLPTSVVNGQVATFTFDVTCPALGAPMNFCLRAGASNYFGAKCFSWDLGSPLGAGSVPPQLTEVCGDGIDNDGDGTADLLGSCGCGGRIRCSDGLCNAPGPATYFFDGDGDGDGNPGASVQSCSQPANYVTNNDDCCDSDARAHPGQTDSFASPTACGGFDFNCDGSETGAILGVDLSAPQASDFVGAAQSAGGTGCSHDGWTGAIPACGGAGTAQECCFCAPGGGTCVGSCAIFTSIISHPDAVRGCR